MSQSLKSFLNAHETVRRWLAISSLFLFVLLFAARGGKSEIMGGVIFVALFFTTALSFKLIHFDQIARHPFVPAALGYFCWTLISTAFSHELWRSFLPLLKIAGCGAFWLTASLAWGKKQRDVFGLFLWGIAFVQATLVFAAHWGGFSLPFLLPGNPQYVAFWITMASLSALDRVAKADTARARIGCALLAVYLAVALFVLPSRSGLLAMAAGVAFLSFRYFRWRSYLYGTAIILCGIVLVPSSLWKQSFKLNDPLAWKRLDIWTSTLKGIAAKPLLGWGPGNYENLYQAEALPQLSLPVRFDRSTPFAHNDFLQAAAEFGFPALAFLVFGLAGGLMSKMEDQKKSLLIAASTFSIFNFPFFLPVNGWLLAGLLSESVEEPTPRPLDSVLNRGFIGVFVFLGLLALGIAGFRGMDRLNLLPEFMANPWNMNQILDNADERLHDASTVDPVDIANVEAVLRHVLRVSPDNPRAWRDLAHLKSDHSAPPQLEEARTSMNRAISLRPTQAVWGLELGELVLRQGDSNSALSAAHRALALEPDYAEAALFLGSVLRQSGENARAEAWLNGYSLRHNESKSPLDSLSPYARMILSFDSDAFKLEIARCQSAQKNYSKALHTLSLVTSDQGGMRSFEEAGVHYAMGKYALAEQCLLQALRSDKNNPAFIRNLDLVRGKNK